MRCTRSLVPFLGADRSGVWSMTWCNDQPDCKTRARSALASHCILLGGDVAKDHVRGSLQLNTPPPIHQPSWVYDTSQSRTRQHIGGLKTPERNNPRVSGGEGVHRVQEVRLLEVIEIHPNPRPWNKTSLGVPIGFLCNRSQDTWTGSRACTLSCVDQEWLTSQPCSSRALGSATNYRPRHGPKIGAVPRSTPRWLLVPM